VEGTSWLLARFGFKRDLSGVDITLPGRNIYLGGITTHHLVELTTIRPLYGG
jgi:hypothetical protein